MNIVALLLMVSSVTRLTVTTIDIRYKITPITAIKTRQIINTIVDTDKRIPGTFLDQKGTLGSVDLGDIVYRFLLDVL